MANRGITLVELLVVIVILLALAAVVVPVTHMVRSRSLLSSCGNNLGQLGKAVTMYADDYHGWLPCYLVQGAHYTSILRDGSQLPRNYEGKPKEWRDSLGKYTRSTEVFWCPADRFRGRLAQSVSDEPQDARRQLYTSYLISSLLWARRPHRVDPAGNLRVRLSALPLGPSRTIYLVETVWPPERRTPQGTITYDSQHGQVENLLLLDGSVRSLRIGEEIPWAIEPPQ